MMMIMMAIMLLQASTAVTTHTGVLRGIALPMNAALSTPNPAYTTTVTTSPNGTDGPYEEEEFFLSTHSER